LLRLTTKSTTPAITASASSFFTCSPLFLYDLPDLLNHVTAHPPSGFRPAQRQPCSTWNLRPANQRSVARYVCAPMRRSADQTMLMESVTSPLTQPVVATESDSSMSVDSVPLPCPRCCRQSVLVTYGCSRQWVHVGTWRPDCAGPGWSADTTRQPKHGGRASR
jgi:hypothetical protein